MIEIMCVLSILTFGLTLVLVLVHYMKNCSNGEFSIKGEFFKLFKFEIHASGSKKGSKK